jgi:hypothetical protein
MAKNKKLLDYDDNKDTICNKLSRILEECDIEVYDDDQVEQLADYIIESFYTSEDE